MNKYFTNILYELKQHLELLRIDSDNKIEFSEQALDAILLTLKKIKAYTANKGFKTKQEEIYFFKKIKPQFLAEFIYYNALYKIEAKTPLGGKRIKKKYFNEELTKIKQYFDKNSEFCRYYRTDSIYLDDKYFLRREFDIKMALDSYYIESDKSFSTSHDYKVAKIIANDKIQSYLEETLTQLNTKNYTHLSQQTKTTQNWTASKVALIELIYALHCGGAINQGNSDLKEIVSLFENIFNIKLGQFHRTFIEIQNRKSGRTNFLDQLKENLIRRMNQADE